MKTVIFWLIAVVAISSLALGACGKSTTATEQPVVEPEQVNMIVEDATGESPTHHYHDGLLIFDTTTFSEFTWPEFGVVQKLPRPTWAFSPVGQVITNSSVGFSGYISGVNREDYDNYITACYDMGFNIDYIQSLNEYSAFNADGDWLVFCYYETQETFYISLLKEVQ